MRVASSSLQGTRSCVGAIKRCKKIRVTKDNGRGRIGGQRRRRVAIEEWASRAQRPAAASRERKREQVATG